MLFRSQPGLGNLLLQFLTFTFSFAMFVSALPLFVERRLTWNGRPFGPEQTGYAWAYAGFMGIFLQGPALGRLVKRFGEAALTRVGFLAYVVGYVMLAFCDSVPWLAVTMTGLVVGGLVLWGILTFRAQRRQNRPAEVVRRHRNTRKAPVTLR